MSQPQAAATAKPKFDNQGQYSRSSILRYEKIFGEHYISTGGHETTENLCRRLAGSLHRGVRVLDVGSGIGGAAFHLARAFGARVTGIDLAEEMVAIALEHAGKLGLSDDVKFILGDVLETPFPEKFDIIWSRDALMHIADKARLFARLHDLLADGGRIAITDYARGKTPACPAFEDYIVKTGYHVVEPEQYGQLLRAAGFKDVLVDDSTSTFVDILRRESKRLVDHRADFLSTFSAEDLNYLIDRWAMKERFCEIGDMKWGIYQGIRRGRSGQARRD
jgi:phosphoethanolamine N-methyltransferase